VLTKDLIRCRVSGNRVSPQFVPVDRPDLLELAEELLAVYRADPPPTRGEIAEAVNPLITAFRDAKFARGLDKLLTDRCEFSHASDRDFPSLRRQLFEISACLLKAGPDDDYGAYRQQVLDGHADLAAAVEEGIYADLPENERLIRFRDLYPRQLLERYNVALVQSLLLRADRLEVTVASPAPAKMRKLMKYLKFFRLLTRIHRVGEKGRKKPGGVDDAVMLTVDGPGSMFSHAKKYGLQLASFFPAVCDLENWRLDADVEWRGAGRELRLDQRSGLVSHYRNFSAHVPEEIRMFHQHFTKTVADWHIVGHTPFIDAGQQELVFPDLSFEHDSGRTVHLELFHRWHASQLLARLAMAEGGKIPALIVGVDRSLERAPETASALERSEWFATHGFLFRDYPPVSKVRKLLDALLGME